jgi:hypothetical protein
VLLNLHTTNCPRRSGAMSFSLMSPPIVADWSLLEYFQIKRFSSLFCLSMLEQIFDEQVCS